MGHDAIVEDTCKVVAIHTCTELENDYLEAHREVNCKPVIPVGLLPPADERTPACRPYW